MEKRTPTDAFSRSLDSNIWPDYPLDPICFVPVSGGGAMKKDEIGCPKTLGEAVAIGETSVIHFMRQGFTWAFLICEDPEQRAILQALGEKVGVLPKEGTKNENRF